MPWRPYVPIEKRYFKFFYSILLGILFRCEFYATVTDNFYAQLYSLPGHPFSVLSLVQRNDFKKKNPIPRGWMRHAVVLLLCFALVSVGTAARFDEELPRLRKLYLQVCFQYLPARNQELTIIFPTWAVEERWNQECWRLACVSTWRPEDSPRSYGKCGWQWVLEQASSLRYVVLGVKLGLHFAHICVLCDFNSMFLVAQFTFRCPLCVPVVRQ